MVVAPGAGEVGGLDCDRKAEIGGTMLAPLATMLVPLTADRNW